MISLMKFLGGDKISRRKFLATPDHSYFPICIEAMKLGIHVYVEKPFVRTSYECELFAGGTEVRCYHADELPRTFFLFIIDLKLKTCKIVSIVSQNLSCLDFCSKSMIRFVF